MAKDHGSKEKDKGSAPSLANIKRIRSVGMVSLNGQVETHIRENTRMMKDMELVK